MSTTTRRIETKYWAKPVPSNKFDWEARFKDGDEEGPCGYGPTEVLAIADLMAEAALLEIAPTEAT